MKNKIVVLSLLLLMVSYAAINGSINKADKKKLIVVSQIDTNDESGEEMPSLVDQTFDDIAQDPQDFIKEDEDVEKDEEEAETDADDNGESDESTDAEIDSASAGVYVDEFDSTSDTASSELADAPECRRPSVKKVSWFTRLKTFLGF